MYEVHRDGHLHDPYDTIELARLEGDVLMDMARIGVMVAMKTPRDLPDLRVTPTPDLRAVYVASHTEAPHMTPACLTEFGMTLAWDGWDLDIVPYGKPLTADDLADATLVIVPPVHDYPTPSAPPELYDESWSQAEINLVESWVADGGLLVLANSAHRLKYYNMVLEENEDTADLNDLASCFGVEFSAGVLPLSHASVVEDHPLVTGIQDIQLVDENGIPFEISSGQILATAMGNAVAVVPYGDGEVLVLADLGILGVSGYSPLNLNFWRNLSSYARSR